jgi:hypothetical protein
MYTILLFSPCSGSPVAAREGSSSGRGLDDSPRGLPLMKDIGRCSLLAIWCQTVVKRRFRGDLRA